MVSSESPSEFEIKAAATKVASKGEFVAFYAWQSDSPSRDNRNFIESALESALKIIAKEGSVESSPRLDKDTKGISGIPDIANTILEKIRAADAFVADVSFVGVTGINGKIGNESIPNPNVMLELGYALSELGWERIVLILNTSTGKPEDLPFDLRNRKWPVTYEITANSDESSRTETKRKLAKQVQSEIEAIAKLPPRHKRGTTAKRLDALESMVSALSGSIAQYTTMAQLVGGLQKAVSGNADETIDGKAKCQKGLNELITRVSGGKFHNVKFQQGIFVLSVKPASVTAPLPLFEPKNEQNLNLRLQPLGVTSWSHRSFGDRFVTTSGAGRGEMDSATEITIDGCINAASHDVISISAQFWAFAGQKEPVETVNIPSAAFEKEVIDGVFKYIQCLRDLNTLGPWYVAIGAINLKKSILHVSPRFMFSGRAFDGDEIRPPVIEIPADAEIENQQSVARILRPAFDYIWREHNFPRSLNYGETGDWIGQ